MTESRCSAHFRQRHVYAAKLSLHKGFQTQGL